jgi:hypothetical protein
VPIPSDAQGCKLLTDLSFTFYLPKLGSLEPLAALGFIFELFNSFKLFKMETKTIRREIEEVKRKRY